LRPLDHARAALSEVEGRIAARRAPMKEQGDCGRHGDQGLRIEPVFVPVGLPASSATTPGQVAVAGGETAQPSTRRTLRTQRGIGEPGFALPSSPVRLRRDKSGYAVAGDKRREAKPPKGRREGGGNGLPECLRWGGKNLAFDKETDAASR